MKSPSLKKEAEIATERLGYCIPPYRLASMMQTAQKIVKLIATSDISVSYSEGNIILEIVKEAFGKAGGSVSEKNGGKNK